MARPAPAGPVARGAGAEPARHPAAATTAAAGGELDRPLPALVAGTLGVVAATLALVPFGPDLTRAAPVLLLLVPVLVAGALGGRLVAAVIALEAAFALASGFLPPIGSPKVDMAHDAVALAFFVIVAGTAGVIAATILSRERHRARLERTRRQSLELVDQQRSALLRSVSHDLRTPLATIRAVTTDLQDGAPFDDATRAELVGLVIAEAERLDRLVANLLSMSRIEAGAFLPDREAVDLGELVEACTARLARALAQVRVDLDLAPDLPPLQADYSQLDQVVSNLLENAARHSPPGGTVTVRTALDGDHVELVVADEGPGVPRALWEEVLEPFATTGAGGSTGIGLAICRSITEAHGGTIAVDDAPDGGARFSVRLPVGPGLGAGRR